jgi:hypothetical protein
MPDGLRLMLSHLLLDSNDRLQPRHIAEPGALLDDLVELVQGHLTDTASAPDTPRHPRENYHRDRQHPAHRWMLGRVVYQCPGVTEEADDV